MNLKKSKTSVHKLFWALCIISSGTHVHGVESSTGTSTTGGAETLNTFLRPNSVEEADGRFDAAASIGDVELVERILKEMRGDCKGTPQTVENNEGGHGNQEQSREEPKEESKEQE